MGLVTLVVASCTCPATTIRALFEKAPVSDPEVVCVRAVYRGEVGCGSCPADALCQPCMPAVLLAESATTPPEGFVWIFGTAEGLVEGQSYVFELSVRPGFAEQLHTQDNNPVYYDGPPPLELRTVRD